MTAREDLIRSVYSTLSQNQMEVIVDAFAHELAEKIRNMGDCNAAADLIDPEVSDNGQS